jgi:signal transduction histidine kinase
MWWLIAHAAAWIASFALVASGGAVAYAGLFLLTAVSLSVLATLAGQLRATRRERSAIATVLDQLSAAADVRDAMHAILPTVLSLFDARSIVVISHDRNRGRFHRWSADRSTPEPAMAYAELCHAEAQRYLFPAPQLWSADRRRSVNVAIPDAFCSAHPWKSLLAVSTTFGEDWSDRVFVVDARSTERRLQLLATITKQAGAAIHNLELVGQLRSRVGAAERARVARELHDGVIQSLIGLEMQVDVWRRDSAADVTTTLERLAHIQQVLRTEVQDLRDLIQQMRPPLIDPEQLLDYLADLVERFQRQSGISAHFVSEIDEIALSARVCGELARVVQEALVNVRKHSGAQHVLVRVSAPPGYWKFEIDDDGRGFGFAGRHSHADLEVARKGPVVIKERVRSIGGTLAVESTPGQGARVEVWLPRQVNG